MHHFSIFIDSFLSLRVPPPSLTWQHSSTEYACQVIPKYSVYFHNKSYFSDYVFISLYDIYSNYSHKYITYKQVYIITILKTISSTINRFDGKHNWFLVTFSSTDRDRRLWHPYISDSQCPQTSSSSIPWEMVIKAKFSGHLQTYWNQRPEMQVKHKCEKHCSRELFSNQEHCVMGNN